MAEKKRRYLARSRNNRTCTPTRDLIAYQFPRQSSRRTCSSSIEAISRHQHRMRACIGHSGIATVRVSFQSVFSYTYICFFFVLFLFLDMTVCMCLYVSSTVRACEAYYQRRGELCIPTAKLDTGRMGTRRVNCFRYTQPLVK